MTSPITHEKIIEVLRLLTAIAEGYPVTAEQDQYVIVENPDYQPDNGEDPNIVFDIETDGVGLRDLYQRLQAEKEGGWQPIETAPRDGKTWIEVRMPRADGEPGWWVATAVLDDEEEYSRHSGVDIKHYNGSTLVPGFHFSLGTTWRSLDPPLNQEGGDAAGNPERPDTQLHVAPPASANAGTGRATLRHPNINHRLREWHEKFTTTGECSDALVAGLLCAAEEIEALRNDNRVVRSIALAEGKRIGIEEAAKAVGEIADKLAQRPERTVAEIVDLINEMPLRALTGDPQT